MVRPPVGEEDDDATTLRSDTTAQPQFSAHRSASAADDAAHSTTHQTTSAHPPHPPYLKAEEPEDNIVHTSYAPDTPHTSPIGACSAHQPRLSSPSPSESPPRSHHSHAGHPARMTALANRASFPSAGLLAPAWVCVVVLLGARTTCPSRTTSTIALPECGCLDTTRSAELDSRALPSSPSPLCLVDLWLLCGSAVLCVGCAVRGAVSLSWRCYGSSLSPLLQRRQPLTPAQIMEDISADHANKVADAHTAPRHTPHRTSPHRSGAVHSQLLLVPHPTPRSSSSLPSGADGDCGDASFPRSGARIHTPMQSQRRCTATSSTQPTHRYAHTQLPPHSHSHRHLTHSGGVDLALPLSPSRTAAVPFRPSLALPLRCFRPLHSSSPPLTLPAPLCPPLRSMPPS